MGVEISWLPVNVLLLPLMLLSRVSDLEYGLLLFDSAGGLCAVRYRLPDDSRFRIDGSEKLAMALDVLSRASAANENKPPRFCLETGDCVDWRFVLKVLSRFEFETFERAAGAGEDVRSGPAIE